MRTFTVKCDKCGFEKTYDNDFHQYDELKAWATICIYGPYKDMEICPKCVKSLFGVTKLEEEKKNDQSNN